MPDPEAPATLVVGGGVGGMRAALDLAEAGIQVYLIEDTPGLCQGCGTCTAECPANAIQLLNYLDEHIIQPETAGLGAWLPKPALRPT